MNDSYDIYKGLEYLNYQFLSKIGKNVKDISRNYSSDKLINKKKKNEIIFPKKEISYSSIFYEKKKRKNTSNKKNIENIKNWKIKYKVSPDILFFLYKEKNKSPPCGYYNPNYNSIQKHISTVKLKPIKKKIEENNKNLVRNIFLNKKIISRNEAEKSKELNISNETLKNNNFSNEKIHIMSFDKYSSRKNFLGKTLYDNSNLNPIYKLLEKNISIPNFKKMTSRERKKKLDLSDKIKLCIDYYPNYNAIYCNKYFPNKKEIEFNKKQFLVKKIWKSFKTSTKYLVIPSINKK